MLVRLSSRRLRYASAVVAPDAFGPAFASVNSRRAGAAR
jgi:hypothetical protein